ncbi:MAG: sensor histidine kinase [Novosphingobium sp.]
MNGAECVASPTGGFTRAIWPPHYIHDIDATALSMIGSSRDAIGTGAAMISLDDIKRAIVSRKSPALQAAVVVLCLLVATAIRWFTDRGANGVPFATFLPAVVIAAIFLDWRYAALTAGLSIMIARQLFGAMIPTQTVPALVLFVAFALTALFMIVVGFVLRRTIFELNQQSERFQTYNAELQHRAKNALQVVRALASRASRASDPVEFYEALAGRMDLMIRANELLGMGTMRQCGLSEVAQMATEPFPRSAIRTSGPDVRITEEAGMPLTMALHELGTNALKYGALSVESGVVDIEWAVHGDEIHLAWRESGGPQVVPPTTRGLGSRLLVAQGGLKSVDLQFDPAGVVCRMVVPAAR